MQLGRRRIVVFNRIAPAEDLRTLKPGDVLEHRLLHVLGQARADAVPVIFERVPPFRLQKDLVALLVGETHDLVFNGRTIARPARLDLAGVHRGPP